jgi:hypothetical protein
MKLKEPTKWELFLEGFHDFWYAWDCYNDGDELGYDEFWEALSSGWYDEYIYPYDDIFYGHIPSPERKLRLDAKPYFHTIYVSEEAYDRLIEAINKPPEYDEKIARVLQRKAPWDE